MTELGWEHGHLTAEQLHGELAPELPSLSPATIYATLELLGLCAGCAD